MSRTTRDFKLHSDPYKALMRRASIAALAGIAAVLAAGAFALAQAPAQEQGADKSKNPQLASAQFAWLALGVTWFDPPPGLGHGPIRADPAHPYVGNRDRGQVTLHIGNTKDPVLKPWAAKQMQESNEEVLSGKRGLPFSAQQSCYPGGVPEQLLTPAEPFYFIQTSKQVWMIWETDGTLVVDTIGLQAKDSYLDWFRTPHTDKLHVVERYKLSDDGKRLEVLV